MVLKGTSVDDLPDAIKDYIAKIPEYSGDKVEDMIDVASDDLLARKLKDTKRECMAEVREDHKFNEKEVMEYILQYGSNTAACLLAQNMENVPRLWFINDAPVTSGSTLRRAIANRSFNIAKYHSVLSDLHNLYADDRNEPVDICLVFDNSTIGEFRVDDRVHYNATIVVTGNVTHVHLPVNVKIENLIIDQIQSAALPVFKIPDENRNTEHKDFLEDDEPYIKEINICNNDSLTDIANIKVLLEEPNKNIRIENNKSLQKTGLKDEDNIELNSVIILRNGALTEISGLENIKMTLTVEDNPSLDTLAITHLPNHVALKGNAKLKTVYFSSESLYSAKVYDLREFVVLGCPMLSEITFHNIGTKNITTLVIKNNNRLTKIHHTGKQLSEKSCCETIRIDGNPMLYTVCLLIHIQRVGNGVIRGKNLILSDMNITRIDDTLTIDDIGNKELNLFSCIQKASTIIISNNKKLEMISSIGTDDCIINRLQIRSNSVLRTIEPSSIDRETESLSICYNDNLSTINAFEFLSKCRILTIEGNAKLKQIPTFQSLQEADQIHLNRNNSITEIKDVFPNLSKINIIYIRHNASLQAVSFQQRTLSRLDPTETQYKLNDVVYRILNRKAVSNSALLAVEGPPTSDDDDGAINTEPKIIPQDDFIQVQLKAIGNRIEAIYWPVLTTRDNPQLEDDSIQALYLKIEHDSPAFLYRDEWYECRVVLEGKRSSVNKVTLTDVPDGASISYLGVNYNPMYIFVTL